MQRVCRACAERVPSVCGASRPATRSPAAARSARRCSPAAGAAQLPACARAVAAPARLPPRRAHRRRRRARPRAAGRARARPRRTSPTRPAAAAPPARRGARGRAPRPGSATARAPPRLLASALAVGSPLAARLPAGRVETSRHCTLLTARSQGCSPRRGCPPSASRAAHRADPKMRAGWSARREATPTLGHAARTSWCSGLTATWPSAPPLRRRGNGAWPPESQPPAAPSRRWRRAPCQRRQRQPWRERCTVKGSADSGDTAPRSPRMSASAG